jgi:hypothetical protein
MASVIADRLTAQVDGEVVVFLIGMRINRFWKIHKWLPVALANSSIRLSRVALRLPGSRATTSRRER